MNNKKFKVWLPLLFSITMVAGMFLGYKLRDGLPGKNFFYIERRRPVQEIIDLVKNRYVDSVNMQALSDTAITAMLAMLDPHSVFIPAEDLQTANEDIAGNFYGIGVEFNIFNDTIHVVNVLKDGPSYNAGILTGDKIIKAGDSILSGKNVSIERIRKNLRGPLDEMVALTIVRDNKIKVIPVSRGVIPVSSVDAAYMVNKNIGFIRLNKFSKQTYREFMESLQRLKKQGLTKLILDLRGNGGGVLDEAVEIADEFLAGDKLITYTDGVHVGKKEYRCKREGQFETGELIVLSDEGSASASEILMGALQDWDRATIVGRTSFGKGLVQEQFILSDRSALRLTVARYFTPLGRSIQRSYSKGGKAYYEEIADRFYNGALTSADSIKKDTTRLFVTREGKKIYGGGGITPDFFIPGDTSNMGTISARLYSKGLVSDFGYLYFLQNRDIAREYKTPADLINNFNIKDEEWDFLKLLAAKDSITLDGISAKEKEYLKKSLKSSLARQLFRLEGYYEDRNTDDRAIKKAIELLNN